MLSSRLRIVLSLASVISASASHSFAQPTLAQSDRQGSIIIKVTGLRSEKGQVRIAVFNSSAKWLGDEPVNTSTINADGLSVTWKFNDVPHGDYGIAVFHDENKNGKMDKNFLGIPLEPYGFSNNVRVTFGPPKWEKSKFVVKGSNTEVSIEVK